MIGPRDGGSDLYRNNFLLECHFPPHAHIIVSDLEFKSRKGIDPLHREFARIRGGNAVRDKVYFGSFPLQFHPGDGHALQALALDHIHKGRLAVIVDDRRRPLVLAGDVALYRLCGGDCPLIVLIGAKGIFLGLGQVKHVIHLREIRTCGLIRNVALRHFQRIDVGGFLQHDGHGLTVRIDCTGFLSLHGKGGYIRIHTRIGHVILYQTGLQRQNAGCCSQHIFHHFHCPVLLFG